MLTLPADYLREPTEPEPTEPEPTEPEPTDQLDRPAYRPYPARVNGLRRLGPHFVRVTFVSDQFIHFGTAGLDQRVKIVLPIPGFGLSDLGEDGATWYDLWRGLPEDQRNPFRTYTVRAIHPERRELEVDFVAHPAADGETLGPAATWLDSVTLGSEVIIVGPDERSSQRAIGLDWHPGDATRLLLCGDETAAPAIASILESLAIAGSPENAGGPETAGSPETAGGLSAGVHATAFIEVPDAADAMDLELPGNVDVTWLARGDAHVGTLLEPAVRDWVARNPASVRSALAVTRQLVPEVDVDRDLLWDSPVETTGEFYAWIAGEAAVVKSLRRFLVSEIGVDRNGVAFMGYWRRGRSESQ